MNGERVKVGIFGLDDMLGGRPDPGQYLCHYRDVWNR